MPAEVRVSCRRRKPARRTKPAADTRRATQAETHRCFNARLLIGKKWPGTPRHWENVVAVATFRSWRSSRACPCMAPGRREPWVAPRVPQPPISRPKGQAWQQELFVRKNRTGFRDETFAMRKGCSLGSTENPPPTPPHFLSVSPAPLPARCRLNGALVAAESGWIISREIRPLRKILQPSLTLHGRRQQIPLN